MVASAAGGRDGATSLICIWNVQDGACRKTMSHHRGAVQSMAFSRDDLLFLSVGQSDWLPWGRFQGAGGFLTSFEGEVVCIMSNSVCVGGREKSL